MSVVGPPEAVYESNRKLFARYMNIFKSRNHQDFVQYAIRFSKWLGDSKAYYPEARQEIISLLLVAQANLRRTLGLHDEFAKPFHVDHFPNNEMVAAYAAMVRAVEPFSVFFVEPSLSAHLLKLRETVHDSSIPHYTPMSSIPTNPASMLPQQNHHSNGNTQYQAPLPLKPQSSSASVSSTSDSIGNTYPTSGQNHANHIDSRRMGASPSILPPVANSPIPPQSTESGPSKPIPKKVVKKRKALDYQQLYQQDVSNFLQKQQASQPSTPLFLPSEVSSATPEPVKQAKTEVHSPDLRPAHTLPDNHELAIPTPISSSLEANHPSIHVEVSSMDMVVDKGQLESDVERSKEEICTHHIRADSLGIPQQSESSGFESREKANIASNMVVDRPLDIEAHSSTMAIESTPPSGSMQVVEENNDVPCISQPLPNVQATNQRHLDKVLARRFMYNSDGDIQFDVTQDVYEYIARWRDRMNLSTDLAATACITLECFPSDDIRDTLDDKVLSAELSSRSSSWPDSGHLHLKLRTNDTTETIIPLSPPLEVTPHNSVDISDFVSSGVNTARLLSTEKPPNLLFVVHVHSPTARQQEIIKERRGKEHDWQTFLADLTKPFIHPQI